MTASADLCGENAKNLPRYRAARREAEILTIAHEGADLAECVERVIVLFAPILAETERLKTGLSALVHCQPALSRAEMREAAAGQ